MKEKLSQLKIINNKAMVNLSKKYSAVLGWDTLGHYTYLYQEMFIEDKKLICFEGQLSDIIKIDSIYYLKVQNVNTDYSKNFLAQISINNEKFIELQKILKLNNYTNDGSFIFKVSKIFSVCPQIKADIELVDKELDPRSESYSYLAYDFNEPLLVFKGELIDFRLNETIDKINDE